MATFSPNVFFPIPAGSSLQDQRLTVDSTVGGVQFTAVDSAKAQFIMFDIQTADVMVTVDGTAPTTTNGHRLYAGTFYTWSTGMVNAAKFIAATATSGVVHASPIAQ